MQNKKTAFIPTNDLSYRKIAGLYVEIINDNYQNTADFVLPLNPKFSAFGNKIAFCQLINTWFRKYPASNLRLYDNGFPTTDIEITKTIQSITNKAEVHVLLALCYGVKNKILGYSNKEQDYTDRFIKPLENRIIFDYRELSTNYNSRTELFSEYFQIHPDFFSKDFFINNLNFYLKYGREFIIKNEESINEVSKRLFGRIEKFGSDLSYSWVREVQKYFYEIFDNTYEWGRHNWLNKNSDNNSLNRSNRIFFISSKNFTNLENNFSNTESNLETRLFKFSKINSKETNWGKSTQLLELSILDNGIGIVQTYKKREIQSSKIDIREEYEFLIEAFRFGKTSDNSSRSNLRGLGLYKVVENIKDVFLIIRTGHLHLYRDFGSNPYQKDEDFFLFDVSDVDNLEKTRLNNIKKYPWADGTFFTFIIPF